MTDDSKLAIKKAVNGKQALIVRDGADYSTVPEDIDFEALLARDISEKDEDFILKGSIVEGIFIATDVVYHGEFMANSPWKERFLELKKNFDYTPSIRWSGSIVVNSGDEILDAAKAFSFSPYFEGVYVEGYESTMFDDRRFIPGDVIEEADK